ncbi:hypothetical protein T4D_8086 [Trichinella pseudospiralis]|uniref:Uncharacterized protein n=1 Tax=Trichinella pseudospiralis TaxID=6337 RepID=A0A0V1DLV9_TRIPS|nr:hypothetical protein T4D_8086 [Trichinella pseudospiralis]
MNTDPEALYLFERSRGSRLIETAGLPTGLPFSSASFSFP